MFYIHLVKKLVISMIVVKFLLKKQNTLIIKEQLIQTLISQVKPEDKVLVKGSRGMKLEEVVDALL